MYSAQLCKCNLRQRLLHLPHAYAAARSSLLLARSQVLQQRQGQSDCGPNKYITLRFGVPKSDGGDKMNPPNQSKPPNPPNSPNPPNPPRPPRPPPRPTKISLRIIPAMCPPVQNYDERNMQLERVLSPHLSIYKKQLTSVMSIMLRISGVVLAIGVYTMGLTGLLSERDITDWAEMFESLESSQMLLNFLKFFIIFPFAYHVVAATRYLIFHFDMFLTKSEIYTTGYVAIALTVVLALALALLNVELEKEEVVEEPPKKQYWFVRMFKAIINAIRGGDKKDKVPVVKTNNEGKLEIVDLTENANESKEK